MRMNGKKGQYFSFDAIIATVILVVAVTTLASYWFSIQSVVDAKSSRLYSEARDAADSLLSPGVPSGWPVAVDASDLSTLSLASQLGVANGYTNDINETKVRRLMEVASASAESYAGVKNMLHVGGYGEELYILVQQADLPSNFYSIGCDYTTGLPSGAAPPEVAITHRGGAMHYDDGDTAPVPVRILVAVWRQDSRQSNWKACPG